MPVQGFMITRGVMMYPHSRLRRTGRLLPGRALAIALGCVLLLAWLPATGGGGKAVAATGALLLCSNTASGTPANGNNAVQCNTPDGRYVAFESTATNLVAGDGNGKYDIYRKDMLTGEVVRCSVGSSGEEPGDNCNYPSISADGRYVAFHSKASNLVAGDGNGVEDVFVKDLVTGTLTRCSTGPGGVEANGASLYPSLSADGAFVAFESSATNLAAGDDNGLKDVFVKNLVTGAVYIASCDSGGSEGDGDSTWPSLSADGRYVAFSSMASNLVAGDDNGALDAFRKDTVTGAVAVCSSSAAGTFGSGASRYPSISADGRFVAFQSTASNLVPGDTNDRTDVFRKDMQSGSVLRCSLDYLGREASDGGSSPAISPDGRYVGFCSTSALIPGSYSGYDEVYIADAVSGKVRLCSCTASNIRAVWMCKHPTVSLNGKYVFFLTDSYNLVGGVGISPYDDHVFRKEPLGEPPYIESLTPPSGAAGTEVSIKGVLFGPTQGGSYVAFGTSRAVSYAMWSDTEIRCRVPAEVRGRVEVKVHTPEGTSNVAYFTSYPHIDLVDPDAAPIGCAVEISGSGFGSSSGSGRVLFGDVEAVEYLSWSDNLIRVRVPRVYGNIELKFQNHEGYYSNGVPFTVYDYAVGLAEGYTGPHFQQYLCIGNPNDTEARVEIFYFFPDGTYLDESFYVPPNARKTVDVNEYVNPYFDQGTDVSAIVFSDLEVVVERPMYFNYQGRWTGGHTVVATPYLSKIWFFAEGYTGAGFDEYVCVFNPNDAPADLTFHFQTGEAGEIDRNESIPAMTRRTYKVNELLGSDYECSLLLESDQMVIAERAMYFDYTGLGNHHWEGGHCVIGQPFLSREYYFAEGTTRDGFEEWLTIQNPDEEPVTVVASYQLGEGQGGPVTRSYVIPPESRHTVNVRDEVAADRDVSVRLTSDEYFLAERPMYFRYTGYGAAWEGGHCVIGAGDLSSEWFLAEGYTGSGFQEWICLQNPNDSEVVLEACYLGNSGPVAIKKVVIPPRTRKTLYANTEAGNDLELSCSLRVKSGPPVMVERPMYFDFHGWDGGHDVVGYAPFGSASTQIAGLRAASPGRIDLLRDRSLRLDTGKRR